MRRRHLFGPSFRAVLWFCAVPAFATVITTYNSQADWLAASSGVQTITFEGLAPYHGLSTTFSSWLLDGVTFNGVQGAGTYGMQFVDTNYGSWANYGTNDALWLPQLVSLPTPYFHIVLPTGVTSFGLNLMSFSPHGLSFSVTAGESAFTVPTYDPPTPGFFGATFDAPVTAIDVAPLGVVPINASYALLDNFSFGTANAPGPVDEIPEAGTLLMIGTGLMGLTAIGRRFWKPKAR